MSSIIQPQKTALITGAASGVGFAIAKLCRSKGMHLALLDIDADNLSKAKDTLAALDTTLKTESYVLDVGDNTAWKQIAEEVNGQFPDLDLVVLNAGKAYKPQKAPSDRLQAWVDGDYWHKVGNPQPFSALLICINFCRLSRQTSMAL